MRRRDFLKTTLPLALSGKAAAAPSAAPVLTFGVIADPQYVDGDPIGSRFYRQSLGKLDHAIADLNTRPLDFTVTLGDLIDREFESFAPVMERYAKLKSPHFPILGNHDFSVADADKGRVLAALGMDKAYHSKVIKGWRFVFLDGTDTTPWRQAKDDARTAASRAALKELAAKQKRRPGAGDTAIGAEQMAWLERELAAATEASQNVVLFNHYPIFPRVAGNLLDGPEIISLIDRFPNVAAWMNGHHHAGNYGRKDHCHYVNFKGMVETEKETAYATVRCFPDRLVIEGMGLEPARDLPR